MKTAMKPAVKSAIGIVLFAAVVFLGIWIGENSNILGEGGTEDRVSDDVNWGYSGEGAPENWGNLSDKYSECSEGREQSPIDIDTNAVDSDGDAPGLLFAYKDEEIHSTNTGMFVKVKYDEKSSHIVIDEREYNLIEIHPHTPSEHTIDGESFPMEMHLVHRALGGQLAVVGVMFRLGETHPAVQHFIDAVPINPDDDYFPSEHFNAADLLPTGNFHYGYDGSLTTPPCSEGVKWQVMSEIQEVSQEQVDKISSLTGNIKNNRPVQPLGDRTVTFSR